MKITEKIKEIINKILGKTKRGVAISGLIGIAATGTLTTGCGDKNKDFKQQYEYDVAIPDLENNHKQAEKQNTLAEQLDALEESKQDIMNFLNDFYIEGYRKETGDNTITAKDIIITGPKNQNFVYVNQETGKMITHGSYPEQTEQKLKNDGVSYTIKSDVNVYRVENQKEGKVIDCITLQEKDGKMVPVAVIVGDQYDEPYKSALEKMGTVIPDGLKYAESVDRNKENDKIVDKEKLKKDLEELENEKKNENTVEKQTEEKVEEGFEPGE